VAGKGCEHLSNQQQIDVWQDEQAVAALLARENRNTSYVIAHIQHSVTLEC